MLHISQAKLLDQHFKLNKDYSSDLLQHLLIEERELHEILASSSIPQESRVLWKHRKKLVEWLIEVSDECNLSYQTKHMTIILLDIMIARKTFQREHLQLLGVTCLFISIKFEENHQFKLEDMNMLTENFYKPADIGAMETLILKTLKWRVHYPTPGELARRLIVHVYGEAAIIDMPKFFEKVDTYMDLCFVECEMSTVLPSIIAIVSIMAAFQKKNEDLKTWKDFLVANENVLNLNDIETLYSHIIERIQTYQQYLLPPPLASEQIVNQNFSIPQNQENPIEITNFDSITSAMVVEDVREKMHTMSLDPTRQEEQKNKDITGLECLSPFETPVQEVKTMEDVKSLMEDGNWKESLKRKFEVRGYRAGCGFMDEERTL